MFSKELQDMEPRLLREYLSYILKMTGITMGPNKLTLIQGRVRRRVFALGLKSYESYLEYLVSSKEENEIFINSITTNETTFFRTQRIWEYFLDDFLIKWHETHKGRKMRVWSAASSTGEEAYSVAILCEVFKKKNIFFDYEIVASDISTEVLKKGQDGIYSGRAIDHLKKYNSQYINDFFTVGNNGYQVQDKIRQKVKFFHHNLFNPTSYRSYFDIVFLRNVLIYFETKEQKKVLENVSRSLGSDGVLIIGESESLNNLDTIFKYSYPLIYNKGT